MKIYLDNCCYNRPYDEHTHDRVRIEAIAVMSAVEFCRLAGYGIVGSIAVVNEINKIRNVDKLNKVREFYNRAINDYIPISADIAKRARTLQAKGLKALDGFHLAFAEAAEADFLLTTDDRFEKACAKMNLTLKVINPLNFLPEAIKWAL